MFGVTAIMIGDAMAVAVHKVGSLLVRVDPAEDASMLELPRQDGAGCSMGQGWIRVEPEALRSDAALAGWLQAATRHFDRLNATHT